MGMDKEIADEICEEYFYRDRHSVKLMAEVYDPSVKRFKQSEYLKLALENDQETMFAIQQIMNKGH